MNSPASSSTRIGKYIAQYRPMLVALAAVLAYAAWIEFRIATDSAQAESPAAEAGIATMAEAAPVDTTNLPEVQASVPSAPILIDQLPFLIKKEGHYNLARSLAYDDTSGPAVSVEADNVTIDPRLHTDVYLKRQRPNRRGDSCSPATTSHRGEWRD